MLLTADGGATCLETKVHVPHRNGTNLVCLRCGMLLGSSEEPELGSLLDY